MKRWQTRAFLFLLAMLAFTTISHAARASDTYVMQGPSSVSSPGEWSSRPGLSNPYYLAYGPRLRLVVRENFTSTSKSFFRTLQLSGMIGNCPSTGCTVTYAIVERNGSMKTILRSHYLAGSSMIPYHFSYKVVDDDISRNIIHLVTTAETETGDHSDGGVVIVRGTTENEWRHP